MTVQTESRVALKELIALLTEIDEKWVGPDWNLHSADDVVGAHRALMHMLEGGLVSMFEFDAGAPDFRRIVTPSRKVSGDNGDAIYFDAPVRPDLSYRVRGNMQGAVYFSATVEIGTDNGGMATNTAGVINDNDMDIDAAGNFKILLGGPGQSRNWLPLPEGASRITTRHYYENAVCAAADPAAEPLMQIEVLGNVPPPAVPNDASVSAGIRRVAQALRDRTLGQPSMSAAKQPPFVAITPNQLPKPVPPGDFGLAAVDAHYAMAPFFIGPDEALVITGRWPACRFASLNLWNRHQQTFDYSNRTVSLNRTQTQLETDGTFRIIIAHEDPGLPNWLDSEKRPFGMMFWRYFLAEGDVETPQCTVVKLAELNNQ